MFYQLKKCWRATFTCLADRMCPGGRTLPRPALDLLHGSLRGPWTQGYERYSTGYYLHTEKLDDYFKCLFILFLKQVSIFEAAGNLKKLARSLNLSLFKFVKRSVAKGEI